MSNKLMAKDTYNVCWCGNSVGYLCTNWDTSSLKICNSSAAFEKFAT